MAVADEEIQIAVPRGVVVRESDRQAVDEIAAVIRRERAEMVVIGLPLAHDGAETEQAREVRAFAKKLREKTGAPIEFENEIFTTRMAEAAGGKAEMSDASAAAIILQSYLDKRNKKSGSMDHEYEEFNPASPDS